MTCGPGADQFIESHFKDCVYNVRDYIGFCLGLAAIAFWIVAQLPQYYRNYKTKSAEALSPWFLAQWLLGDTFNLIGALLQGQQLPTTVYTAMYFVIADMFMMMQYIYYGALQRRREQVLKLQARRRHHHRRHHHHHRHGSREREALIGQQPHSSSSVGAADSEQQRQPQEQQQGQSSAWPSQQERRRVPHQAVGQSSSQQLSSGQDPVSAGFGSSTQQAELQDCLQAAVLTDSRADADDCGSCSDSACSSSSEHSSSKGPKPVSRNTSPSRTSFGAAGGVGGLTGTQSCAAAAAAAAGPHVRSLPGVRLPFGDVHWGGVRSLIAVAVLVSMGLISLLPASSTRGFAPVSLSGSSAAAVHLPAGDSTTARAMQAGVQQQPQGSSIHLQTPLLPDSPAAASSSSRSSSSSSDSSSKGWARQRRVGDEEPEHDWSFIVGTGLGYVASILYLCSRMSQIHKNYTRKSSEGLALVMFVMAVCANMCTGTSIILRTFTLVELKEQLPWIIGSLGTISLDMVILWQSTMYSKQPGVVDGVPVQSIRHHHHHHHHREGVERQGLLQTGQQHTAVDMAGAGAAGGGSYPGGGLRGQGAGAGLSGNAAPFDGGPVPPHHRGALIDRRHAAAAAAGDLAADGVEVVLPLVGPSSGKL